MKILMLTALLCLVFAFNIVYIQNMTMFWLNNRINPEAEVTMLIIIDIILLAWGGYFLI